MIKEVFSLINDNSFLDVTFKMKKGICTLMMSIRPSEIKDEAFDHIPPVIISGDVETVETEVLKFLQNPDIVKITNAASGVAEFEKKAAEIEAQNKMVKDRKEKIEKAVKAAMKHIEKEDLVKANDSKMKIISDFKIEHLESNSEYKKFVKQLNELSAKLNTGSLFSEEENNVESNTEENGDSSSDEDF